MYRISFRDQSMCIHNFASVIKWSSSISSSSMNNIIKTWVTGMLCATWIGFCSQLNYSAFLCEQLSTYESEPYFIFTNTQYTFKFRHRVEKERKKWESMGWKSLNVNLYLRFSSENFNLSRLRHQYRSASQFIFNRVLKEFGPWHRLSTKSLIMVWMKCSVGLGSSLWLFSRYYYTKPVLQFGKNL